MALTFGTKKMTWGELSELCESECERIRKDLQPPERFFKSADRALGDLLEYERSTTEGVERATRIFASSRRWPDLSDLERLMLSFRLEFAAATADLLFQQPPPWEDSDQDFTEARIGWLMLFAWDQAGFPTMQSSLSVLLRRSV